MIQRLQCTFPHHFEKLHGQTSARLLDVKRMKNADIHTKAYCYDTMYYGFDKFNEVVQMNVMIVGEDLLRLVFVGNFGIPFTTYRRDNPDNFHKYVDNIGKVFEIIVSRGAEDFEGWR